jgi:hypothetical protein
MCLEFKIDIPLYDENFTTPHHTHTHTFSSLNVLLVGRLPFWESPHREDKQLGKSGAFPTENPEISLEIFLSKYNFPMQILNAKKRRVYFSEIHIWVSPWHVILHLPVSVDQLLPLLYRKGQIGLEPGRGGEVTCQLLHVPLHL